MDAATIFISYTTADDGIVAQIRKVLEGQGLPVWADSRELSGGDTTRRVSIEVGPAMPEDECMIDIDNRFSARLVYGHGAAKPLMHGNRESSVLAGTRIKTTNL